MECGYRLVNLSFKRNPLLLVKEIFTSIIRMFVKIFNFFFLYETKNVIMRKDPTWPSLWLFISG